MTPIAGPIVHDPIRRGGPERLVIALGSNLGDRRAILTEAAERIAAIPGVFVRAVSTFIESVAVRTSGPDESAPPYLNGVLVGHTYLEPHRLLAATAAIEDELGRTRAERWGDRTIDIDLIEVGGRRVNDERLTLPHPRAGERDFVLAPWLEVEPSAVLTGRGRVDELLATLRGASE
ncbi:2-amino-4-hydroxy-6-hydroxymethyldihydropteridine diphosphokinase [Labedella gwakjiensis]|uniref:2-amino-4-hydroxy-6-hydroxymethyldihydropteridine diphosphokinase n=1 Tax=Labedella gwakjiensis TaxID=390269 RepID=A0A2P8GSB8_9MICO|nr:2-amino-4-hydroxy-6-hydroxymethyldihydropteridine diphosphokinase [Labedella gwakjiensis]PSL36858.1 2-amino-4-hydroxy-6-hydroxymethyldihydropteridine diphosphokinase [Labedella gwakjiensis]